MVNIRTPQEMEAGVKAGRKLGPIFDFIRPHIVPGVSTLELDRLCKEFILSTGSHPSFPTEEGYFWTICSSVNDGIIHQIPRKNVILKEGDILKIDVGNIDDETGFQGDAARTFLVGEADEESKKLAECAEECFWECYKLVRPGLRVSDIGWCIQRVAESYGFSALREYGGHGIGRGMHEDPFIPNAGIQLPHRGPMIKANTLICIEPMVMAGKCQMRLQDDNWGVVTLDGRRAAHYENTIAVFPDHNEITTVDSTVRARLEAIG